MTEQTKAERLAIAIEQARAHLAKLKAELQPLFDAHEAKLEELRRELVQARRLRARRARVRPAAVPARLLRRAVPRQTDARGARPRHLQGPVTMEATKIETFADLDEYLRKREILMHAHALAGEWAVELHSVPWHARVMGRGPTLLDALRDAVAKMEMPS